MGMSIWQLAIIAVIVVLLFGTKKLRNLGGDLGSAIKGFKNAVNDDSNANVSSKVEPKTLTESSDGLDEIKQKSPQKSQDSDQV